MLGKHFARFKPCASQIRGLLKPSNQFGNSIILLQDGHFVQELPVLVRHTSDDAFIMKNFGPDDSIPRCSSCDDFNANAFSHDPEIDKRLKHAANGARKEEDEFVAALGRTERVRHIYSLLETATIEGVTPYVALQSLIRISHLESRESVEESDRRFARQAMIQKLMTTILEGEDNETLVNAFMFMKDLKPLGALSILFENLRHVCIDKGASGKLTITQTSRFIHGLNSMYGPKSTVADQLWQGIKSNSSQIDETNVADVCSVLPLLKQSSKVVFFTVLERLPGFWWKLTPAAACDVMDAVYAARLHSPKLCRVLSRWTALALHQLTEHQLRLVLAFFSHADHCDDELQRAVERYCRARGRAARPATVAAIAAFARRFNVRSEPLLETVAAHFAAHQAEYGGGESAPPPRHRLLRDAPPPPADVTAVVRAVGDLDFTPADPVGFFGAVEAVLARRFAELTAEDVLDICLACVYLKRYPLNFFRQVFNPFFLERLPTAATDSATPRLRAKLSLLDSSLTSECPGYRGPMLPRDLAARSVWRDARAARLTHALAPHLRAVPGVSEVEPARLPAHLPLHPLFVPDLSCRRADGRRLLLFLNAPDRYERAGVRPLGAVQLRRRQLARLQLTAVDLPLQQLAQLVVHPALLRRRLAEAVADAQ